MFKPLRSLKLKLLKILFSSDKFWMRYENEVLERWMNCMSNEGKDTLKNQIKNIYLMQRQAGGAKLCFYHDRQDERVKAFKDKAPDLLVAKVTLRYRNNKSMLAKVYLHKGYFFSIEFPKMPQRYAELHGIDLDSFVDAKVEVLVQL